MEFATVDTLVGYMYVYVYPACLPACLLDRLGTAFIFFVVCLFLKEAYLSYKRTMYIYVPGS